MISNAWLYIPVALAWALALFPFPLTLRLRRYLSGYTPADPPRGWQPRVALILPCKGLDPGFHENIAALLSQDYANCSYYFVTATADDPAYGALSTILANRPGTDCHLLVAGTVDYRAQKLTNQLAAVQALAADVEVLAFVDSDIRPRADFVRRLIQPLHEEAVGASTGFRWYSPVAGGFSSYLRATWNAGGLPFLIDDKLNFVWGGAMAIRRAEFERCGVAKAWDRALSDDFGLTHAVKGRGLAIRFVPECVAVSHEDASFTQTLEWTNRQTTIARVYSPPFWISVGIVHGLLNLFLMLGLAFLVAGLLGRSELLLPGVGLLCPVLLEWLNAWLLLPAVLPMLGENREQVLRHA